MLYVYLDQSKIVILGGILGPPPPCYCSHARHLHLILLPLPRVGVDVQGGHRFNLLKIILEYFSPSKFVKSENAGEGEKWS